MGSPSSKAMEAAREAAEELVQGLNEEGKTAYAKVMLTPALFWCNSLSYGAYCYGMLRNVIITTAI